jgi:hypothetical protein
MFIGSFFSLVVSQKDEHSEKSKRVGVVFV